MSTEISHNKTPERVLKKFFKTIHLNLSKKTRIGDELTAKSRMIIGREGTAISLIDNEVYFAKKS